MSHLKLRTLLPGLVAAIVLATLACSGSKDDPTPTLVPSATATPIPEVTETAVPGETSSPTTAPATATATPTPPPAQPIDWADCPSGPFQCAEYDVPLDYADPGGETITLALQRLPAEDPDERLGLLFANPGGPGGSAIDILAGWARSLPSELRSRFDVILFDPRGVGHSSPLFCHDNESIQELIGLNPYPQTAEDWDPIIEATRDFVEGCAAVGGDLLDHMSTRDVARDMDRIREAEGEEQITYFGYSYGTTIGQVYADLFPARVRAMVLDGAVDVSLSFDQASLEQIVGFEAAFQRYLAVCSAQQCIPGDPAQTITALIDEATDAPIPVSDGDRPVGPGEIVQGILSGLYSRTSWSFITTGVNQALNGDGSVILFLADNLAGRDGNEYSNIVESNLAVNCLDGEANRDPQHYVDLAPDFQALAPFFGVYADEYGLYCAAWPAEPQPLTAPKASSAPPIMVIGSTGDPATPYKWAVSLAEQLESGFLVTRDGDGHTAYRFSNESCIDNAVNAYLLDLTLPPEGLTCGNAGIEPAPPVP